MYRKGAAEPTHTHICSVNHRRWMEIYAEVRNSRSKSGAEKKKSVSTITLLPTTTHRHPRRRLSARNHRRTAPHWCHKNFTAARFSPPASNAFCLTLPSQGDICGRKVAPFSVRPAFLSSVIRQPRQRVCNGRRCRASVALFRKHFSFAVLQGLTSTAVGWVLGL